MKAPEPMDFREQVSGFSSRGAQCNIRGEGHPGRHTRAWRAQRWVVSGAGLGGGSR